MRFQVPQFTDVEDKIFGPLTFKQFLYLAGSGGACLIIFYYVPIRLIAFVLMAPVIAFGVALAFYKVNNKPFINVVEAFFKYAITSKLYIWKHDEKRVVSPSATQALAAPLLPKLSSSKLKDLTWSLDVTGNLNPVEKPSTMNRKNEL